MKNKRIYLSSPAMNGSEINYINEAFATNWIAPLGANVDGFEQDVCDYTGVKHAAALSSGTGAIHLALKALGVSDGDIVFCSTLTFSASCNPIIYERAKPIFIDSEPDSWNMSPVALKKALEKYTPKAVIVVNLYGQSADMDEIIKLCVDKNIPIIEDAAESLGATYNGKQSGTFGKIGIFSFNGNKIITTSSGGMLVSDDEEIVKKVRFWSTQSRESFRHYEHKEIGYNYRMSNVLAGIGRGQMKTLQERIQRKKEIYQNYQEKLADVEEITMNKICEYGESNYWLSCILLEKNSLIKPIDIIVALEQENIESRPIWKPMHLQPVFSNYEFVPHNFDSEVSVSEDIFNRGLCLPSDVNMTVEEQNKIIKIVKGLF